jgi:hypothetical protein
MEHYRNNTFKLNIFLEHSCKIQHSCIDASTTIANMIGTLENLYVFFLQIIRGMV